MRLGSPGLRRVQVRTTAVAMIGVLLVIGAAGIGVLRLFEREQVRQMDDRLQEAAAFVDRTLENGTPLPGDAAGDDTYSQVLAADGSVAYATDSLEGLPPVLDVTELPDDSTSLHTVDVDGIGDLRFVALPYRDDTHILIGAPLSEVDDAVASLRRSLLIGLPLAAAGLGIVVWLVVGRTLRPVDEAVRREQRLIADASHDLRSPIAGVRALLETEPSDPAELAQNRADALATLSRLEAIAEDLLRLDRTDGPAESRELVDLDEIVLRQVQRLQREPGPTFDTSALSAGQVVGNESDLERLVENLLANAVRHARAQVVVTLREEDGEVELTVADDGEGVPAEDRKRIFERFTRLDESRTADSGGAGLGLSIVHAVAVDHGGEADVDDAGIGGARFRVRLPASVGAPSGAPGATA